MTSAGRSLFRGKLQRALEKFSLSARIEVAILNVLVLLGCTNHTIHHWHAVLEQASVEDKTDGQDIDHILKPWAHEAGHVSARLIDASDGREVLQMRIELGVLQLEVTDRPDGERPEGFATYLDYLISQSFHDAEFRLDEDQCNEVDREFMQYYYRRICWLALREFDRAVLDADHTLALMDFVKQRSPHEEWTLSHEQYRPFVLFHRTQAAALGQLRGDGGELAIDAINDGLERLKDFFANFEAEENFEDDEMVARLRELREALREQFGVDRTLDERLQDAIATEQYELAAKLRDEIDRRGV